LFAFLPGCDYSFSEEKKICHLYKSRLMQGTGLEKWHETKKPSYKNVNNFIICNIFSRQSPGTVIIHAQVPKYFFFNFSKIDW
jgi:hypothetical protein